MELNWPVSSPTSSFDVTGTRTDMSPWATVDMARDRMRMGRSSERQMK